MSIIVRISLCMIYRRTLSTLRLAPVAFLLVCMLGGSDPAAAQIADKPVQISLPAGDLADALDKLGDQSGVQIMYQPALAKGIKVQAVSGTLTVDEALKQLLAQTGLRVNRVNDKTVVLTRPEPKKGLAEEGDAGGSGDAGAERIVPGHSRTSRRYRHAHCPTRSGIDHAHFGHQCG